MSNGVILYEGPSKLDGAPIVVIATGLKNKSSNGKTGDMIQTWILRTDMSPTEAVKTGADASICGNCPHRGNLANTTATEALNAGLQGGKGRSCYVTLFHAPLNVWKSYHRGIYRKVNAFEARELFAGRMVRLGAYGDPVAAPHAMWAVATERASGWTGYTHQWAGMTDQAVRRWKELVMASADSVADMEAAHALGFRTFRVSPYANDKVTGLEIICPASEEMGKKTDCASCKACMGTSAKARVSVAIAAHGVGKRNVKEKVAA